jgi:hypothetical protein
MGSTWAGFLAISLTKESMACGEAKVIVRKSELFLAHLG